MVLAKWLRGGRSILNKDELWSALLTMNGVTLLDVKIDRSSAPNWYRKFAGGIRDTRHFRFHDIPVLPNEMVGAYRAFARRLTDCGPVGSIISTETETALEVGKSAKSEKERRRVRSLSRSPSPSPTRAARGRTSASPSSRFCLPASASPAVRCRGGYPSGTRGITITVAVAVVVAVVIATADFAYRAGRLWISSPRSYISGIGTCSARGLQ